MVHHCIHKHSVDTLRHRNGVFLFTIVLNVIFVTTEFCYAFITNSTALMAEAEHNLFDILSLFLAWGAIILSRKTPSERYTYGLRSTSVLVSLVNVVLLLAVCGGIAWEAIQRICSKPPLVAGLTVTLVAGVSVIVNGLSAWLLAKGKDDLNVRGAYLHMATDAVIALGVSITGLVMMWTGWYWLDPVTSLVIVAMIIAITWDLLRELVKLAVNTVPIHIEVSEIEAYLRQRPGITDIHDLHIWGISTTESALTVHLVIPAGYPGDSFMDNITQTLADQFSIQHSTLQVEQGTTRHVCTLLPNQKTHTATQSH